ncbi:MAG TPA: alpha-glucan family phosphorylase, partial [Puia sp.]|nr:alpha-glucan family phosphorylase [Puia sp.]
MAFTFKHPYEFDPSYSLPVAYFCMEYAIHQPLKTYCGGLGYLAGSHLRSAFALRQNMVAIGILWKYGYYDQVRKPDRTMDVLFAEKQYGFLVKTDIRFAIQVSGHEVWVTASYLPPQVYGTAPLFLLTTDLPENDYLARSISHKLYDPHPETKIAAAILLGIGGARLLEELHWQPEIYHLNESHALPLAFYLYDKHKDIAEVRKRMVFTNHTPEDGGNPRSDMRLLEKMGFFCGIPTTEVSAIAGVEGDTINHTLAALRLSGLANGVSRLHGQTLLKMWHKEEGLCPILSITNGQNFRYWSDTDMYAHLAAGDDEALKTRKTRCKEALFEVVADQSGEIFNKDVLTIVFAKRFSGYKRADLLLRDMDRFIHMVTNRERPVQIVWAGKPFPMDYTAIGVFDKVVDLCKSYTNCAILTGYELRLSRILKQGADIWLNVPRYTHEASGTSGMTAAMNGAVNVSIADGWVPEFAKDKVNSFIIPAADPSLPEHELDD